MERHTGSPARYRFEDRFLFLVLPLMFLNLLMAVVGFHTFHLQPAGSLAILCSILMASPWIAFIVIYGLYLAEEKDEFQRTILVQSLLWGIGATLATTTIWGTLEKFNLVPPMDVNSVVFLFVIPFTIAERVLRWRYR
jgi:uncharacterized membrane-anchored protein